MFLNLLHSQNPDRFQHGRYASVQQILEAMLSSPWNIVQVNHTCSNWHLFSPPTINKNSHVLMVHRNAVPDLQGKLLQSYISISEHHCGTCYLPVGNYYTFLSAPPILAFDLENCPCYINLELLISGQRYKTLCHYINIMQIITLHVQ